MLLRGCVKCMHTLAESAGSNRRKKKLEREKCAKKNMGECERRKEILEILESGSGQALIILLLT